jgi:DegV family protein with EDD domain
MIRIVTDSTADVPADFVRELNIVVVPAHVIFGEESYSDGVTITRDEFYQRLAVTDRLPTTSTPSAGEFAEVYRQIGGDILSIHLPAKLSSLYSTAYAGAQLVPEARVTLFDSGSLAMGMGWQVIAAARAAQAGHSLDELLRLLADMRQRVRVYAGLDTLEFLRRSGRVSWARARLGQLLHIKPLVEVRDGEVLALERVRTRRAMIDRLKQLALDLGPVEQLAVQHTRAADDARAIAADLAAQLNLHEPPVVCEATTAIGTHVGPNGLGVIAVKAAG